MGAVVPGGSGSISINFSNGYIMIYKFSFGKKPHNKAILLLRVVALYPAIRGRDISGSKGPDERCSMRDIIKKVPIPTAGVALGLAALGNLLQPYAEIAHIACGALSLFLVAMLVAKLIMFPSMLREDMKNSVFASVSATFFMTLMQLAGYLAPVAIVPAFGLWCSAVAGHFVLMTWFTLYYIRRFKLTEVFPTYFICYVGIIVAAVTSPVFGAEAFGQGIFWFGFACYLVLLAVVTMRYIKHEIPEGARPLFCIYAAPMGLSLVGYLSVMPDPNLVFVAVLMGLGQLMLIGVVTRVPKFLALQFYPSYAAMTFPFVISAMALGKGVQALYAAGYSIPALPVIEALIAVETLFAAVMVAYVFVHFMKFFFGTPKAAKAPKTRPEVPAALTVEVTE